MDYSLGECIAARVCDFSEGDFSKFGNAVRKGAIIGAMGLASLAPAKAMSIEDQIKADTRAATTIYQQAMTRHNDMYGTDDMTLNYTPSRKEYIEEILPEFKNTMNQARTAVPSFDEDIKEASTIKPNFKYSGVRELNAIQSGIEEDLHNRTKAAIQKGKEHRDLESMRKGAIISDKDSHKGNPDKNVGEKISEKAGEAWEWTKDTAKNVGDKVSEGAGKAWSWMKGVGSKIADKISGSKNKDKEFSEGDFGINLAKIRNAGRTAALTALIAGTAAFGGWAGNKVGSSNLAIPKAQRSAIVQMEKAADNYDADAAIARLADINLSASGKSVENTGKSQAYNAAADALRDEAKSVRNKATKTSRGWGTFLGSLAGATGGAAAIGAAKRKKKENELIDKYMNNSSNAGTP